MARLAYKCVAIYKLSSLIQVHGDDWPRLYLVVDSEIQFVVANLVVKKSAGGGAQELIKER